jgi:flagellar biosynthesis anti-sigma factor FlgM
LGEDQAQLSGVHVHIQTLMAQALHSPEIRQEKVSALRQAVLGGNYHSTPEQVAQALFDHMVTQSSA